MTIQFRIIVEVEQVITRAAAQVEDLVASDIEGVFITTTLQDLNA